MTDSPFASSRWIKSERPLQFWPKAISTSSPAVERRLGCIASWLERPPRELTTPCNQGTKLFRLGQSLQLASTEVFTSSTRPAPTERDATKGSASSKTARVDAPAAEASGATRKRRVNSGRRRLAAAAPRKAVKMGEFFSNVSMCQPPFALESAETNCNGNKSRNSTLYRFP